MKKWNKERLDYLDLKSFLLTAIILTIIIYGFYHLYDFRDQFRQKDLENFKGNTTGQIISIEPIVRNRQTKWKGTEIYTDSYKIQYTYMSMDKALKKQTLFN